MKNKLIWIVAIVVIILVVISAVNRGPKEKIQIGVILPLTGPAAPITEGIQKSLNMTAASFKNIELVYQDDQCSGKGALSAYNLLKNQGIKIYIAACSGSILALSPVAAEDGNVILSGFGGSIEIRKTGDEMIRFIPDGLSIAEEIVKVMQNNPDEKYVLLHEQQDYPQSVADFLKEKVGNQIVGEETYVATDISFRTQLLKIKNSPATTIIFIPVADSAAPIVYKEMKELAIDKKILGEVNLCDHGLPPVDSGIHGTCLNTVLKTAGYDKYISDYKTEYGVEPTYPFYNAINYDIAVILDDILSHIDKDDPEIVSKVKAKILAGVTGVVTSYKFEPNGEVLPNPDYLDVVDF